MNQQPDPGDGFSSSTRTAATDPSGRRTDASLKHKESGGAVECDDGEYSSGCDYRRKIEPIQLREGGYYRTKAGVVRGPMADRGDDFAYRFLDPQTGRTFLLNGREFDHPTFADLIAECWQEPKAREGWVYPVNIHPTEEVARYQHGGWPCVHVREVLPQPEPSTTKPIEWWITERRGEPMDYAHRAEPPFCDSVHVRKVTDSPQPEPASKPRADVLTIPPLAMETIVKAYDDYICKLNSEIDRLKQQLAAEQALHRDP